MQDLKVTLYYSRSTKNKHVYNDGADGVFGAIYIPKESLPDEPPAKLVLTLGEAG